MSDAERRNGLLHPMSYLWVIGEKFPGWYGNPPKRLLERYEEACKVWKTTPHRNLAKWERKRWPELLTYFGLLECVRSVEQTPSGGILSRVSYEGGVDGISTPIRNDKSVTDGEPQ